MARWFGPKRFGYGVGPRSWQGWAATAVFVLATIGSVQIPYEALGLPHWTRTAGFGVLLILFLLVVWLKYEPDAA